MGYELALSLVLLVCMIIVSCVLIREVRVFIKEFRRTIEGLGDEAAQRRMTALEIECKNANESRAELGAAVISMLERHSELPDDEDVKRLKDLVHFVD